MVVRMMFQIILVLCTINIAVAQAAAGVAKDSCQEKCGNVSIPYPFGIGANCYINKWFAIVCNNTVGSSSPTPYLNETNLEVLNISLQGTVRVNYPVTYMCRTGEARINPNDTLLGSPFVFSKAENRFVGMGCDTMAKLTSSDGSIIGGCMSFCNANDNSRNESSCNGIYCCQTTIPSELNVFNVDSSRLNSGRGEVCLYVFLVEKEWFDNNLPLPNLQDRNVPVVLEWASSNSSISDLLTTNTTSTTYDCVNVTSNGNRGTIFLCSCKRGYAGNPYLPQGCQDIDECADPNPCSTLFNNQTGSIFRCVNTVGSYSCFPLNNPAFANKSQRPLVIGVSTSVGLLFLLIAGWGSYKVIKKRKKIKRKEKFFKRNGGLLLQQQLSSGQVNVENTKMFNSKELENATDHFNVNRILGQGGQGTVYKGMLVDGRIVAVKKSKIIDEGKLEEFINEVVILSQINHRNVVKLLGCCLETEVPLLVYEFISNGTLSQFISDQNGEFPLTWDVRLRIATEIAGALFYLHSAAASPIYHRDIKSTNILLDDKYRAKVADFGTSRSIAIDQTHLTTLVHGTFGYLDPEYFQSSQFTEKSDVYSFGVVLVELLTGQKAISSTRTEEGKSLATYFIHSMKDNRLFDILDSRVLIEGEKEQIIRYGNLAKRCLNLNGKKRPTMKEVTIELEAIQLMQKAPTARQNYEEVEHAKTDIYKEWEVASTSTMSGLDSSKISSLDSQPFLSS